MTIDSGGIRPVVTHPVVDRSGLITRPWADYFARMALAQTSAEIERLLLALSERIAALENGGGIRVVGRRSIRSDGAEIVYIQLVGDEDSPANTSFYGAGPDGNRGFYSISSAIQVDLGELTKSVGPDGVVSLGLPIINDAGGGSLRKFSRDSFGRVTGTSAAVISDLSDVDASTASSGQVLTKQSDGKWRGQSPSGGGGGAMTFIGDVITTGSQAIVSFSGISNGYRNLVIHYRARGTAAAASVTLRARFNRDTGNNYAFYKRNRFGNVQSDGVGYIEFADIAAATAAAGTSDSGCMNVADYRGTAFFKTSSSIGTTYAGAGAGAITDFTGSGWWKSTAAVSALDIYPASGAFADGSVFSLYALQ